jgi:hypothetical protein
MLVAPAGSAQELEPRLWANLPVGVNLFAVAAGTSSGNVLVDPSLPVEGANADVELVAVRYLRAIDLLGKAGRIELTVPYTSGDWQGVLDGVPRSRSTSGFADPRIKLSVNLVGSPALRLPEIREYRQRTIVGASLQVIAPLGQYDSSRLVNLGSNRWTLRPQLGLSRAFGSHWSLELTGTAWLFGDNDSYFGGQTLEQDPLYALQAHLFYSFRPGVWVALGYAHADGGRTRIDGRLRNDFQRNQRYGGAFAYALSRRHGVQLAVASGLSTRIGADFNTISIAYQYLWGGGM